MRWTKKKRDANIENWDTYNDELGEKIRARVYYIILEIEISTPQLSEERKKKFYL
jgi:hypothetical protein